MNGLGLTGLTYNHGSAFSAKDRGRNKGLLTDMSWLRQDLRATPIAQFGGD